MSSTAFCRRVAVACALALAAAFAPAQPCTPMLRGFATGPIDPGPNDFASIAALLPFDEDGPGPLPESLIVAGRFVLPPAAQPTSPIGFVARYAGGQWTPMNAGFTGGVSGALMRDLAVQDFSSVGGPGRSLYGIGAVDGGSVWRWTGSAWVRVLTAGNQGYTLLATTDEQGPVLLAAGNGYAGGVIAWRGTGGWTPYAPLSISSPVFRLRIVDDGSGPALYAVGSFHDSIRNLHLMARLVNGQWTALLPAPLNAASVSDIASFDSGTGPELYISGQFSTQQVSNAGIARLRNGAWEAVNNTRVGISNTAVGPTFFRLVEQGEERLYAGGYIDDFNLRSGLVRLGPAGWETPAFFVQPLGAATGGPGAVSAMGRFNDGAGARTYAGGMFGYVRSAYQPEQFNQGLPCDSLARSTDAPPGFESVAAGLGPTESPSPPPSFRYNLRPITFGGATRLIATGGFGRAGAQTTFNAALFDGQSFTPLNPVIGTSLPQGLQQAAVFTFSGQERIVSSAPFSSIGLICTWDGTNWTRLAAQSPGGSCLALWVKNSQLFALTDAGLWRYDTSFWSNVGSFTAPQCAMIGDAGDGERLFIVTVQSAGPGIYQFDGAALSLWAPLSNTTVAAMCLHDDGGGRRMYITGLGVGQGIQRREGNAWAALAGGGLSVSSGVASLASFDDGLGPALYAAGPISLAGGQQTNGFARWRNGAWAPVTPYVPLQTQGLPRASMAVFNDRLYLAGEFTSIGGLNADHFAVIEPCPFTCSADYNHDGDVGTDQDIEAFFACLGGHCCPRCTADFNNDGDVATDQDIESFFRVLGGGPC